MSETIKKHRYRHEEGKHLIELRVKNPLQLFDARDPAPFRERDLDDDFIEYIMAALREFSISGPVKIVTYVESCETKDLPKESIRDAIHSYLSYQIELQTSSLKSFMKRAQLFLLIGLFILFFCISIAQGLTIPNPPGTMGILREGIIIFGWVSLWKPIELILFDWYPLFDKLRYYKKLLLTEVVIKFMSE